MSLSIRSTLAPLAVTLLAAALLAPPVAAHGRHRHQGHKRQAQAYGHGYRHPAAHHHRHRRSFVVPSTITYRTVGEYRPYYHDRVYYRPHRHHHEIYLFPVVTDRGYALRPHAYCGRKLFHAGFSYHGSRMSFRLGF